MVRRYFPDKEFAAFLFDFDGTVADTMPAHLSAWNQALRVYGLTLSPEQHMEWAGRPTREILELLGRKHHIDLPVEEFLAKKESHYLDAISGVRPIMPVVEIIRASHGKRPMAVVSGSRRKPIEATLQQLGLAPYFSLIVAAEDYAKGKPAPDCFLQAAKKLNVRPEDCLVFEDANLGIEAAHAAGMLCLRVVENEELGHSLVLSLKSDEGAS